MMFLYFSMVVEGTQLDVRTMRTAVNGVVFFSAVLLIALELRPWVVAQQEAAAWKDKLRLFTGRWPKELHPYLLARAQQ
jgi:hypothetical protein